MNPCETCAFGSCGAAKEAYNHAKADICAFGGIPFWCHHGRDGTEYDWRTSPLGPLELEPSNRKMCAGWRAKVAELKRRGYFQDRNITFIRRFIARRALTALETFINKKASAKQKKQAHADLERCVRFISTRSIEEMEIPL